MHVIKKAIKRSLVYQLLQDLKVKKALSQWSLQDQRMFQFYSRFISTDDICFDIGANVGNRTKVFLRLGAWVVAVEPQQRCINLLKQAFGDHPRLQLVQRALGEADGQAELLISEANTISTLSAEWIEAVKNSGRFSEYSWDKKQVVQLTTMDSLIAEYGVPAFIKIDVEGFEFQVIRGLSRSVRVLSLEFTPEFMDAALQCIEHLQRLGNIRMNYSIEENMSLELDEWVSPEECIRVLSKLGRDNKIFGDLYVRFEAPPGRPKA